MSKLNQLENNLEILGLTKFKEQLQYSLSKQLLDNQVYIDELLYLTQAELDFRDERAKQINIITSNFAMRKDLSDFDFTFQPTVDKNKITDLLTLRFIEKGENVLFQGLPGTGKTMLSCIIGKEAASNRISTYFITCNDLLIALRKARFENKLDQVMKKYNKYKLLIIDEIGFLPLSKDDANMFFQLLSQRYEKKSVIITTNVPFSKWGETFNDPVIATAILDRLLHHAHIFQIDGPSYRTKDIL